MLELKIKKTAILFVMAVGFGQVGFAQKKYPYQYPKLLQVRCSLEK